MNAEELNAKTEFYLILSRCFMAPTQPALYDAMKDLLADELRELAAAAGYAIEPHATICG